MGNIDLVIGLEGCCLTGEGACCCGIGCVPAYLVFSEKLFPKPGLPRSFADFNGKKFVYVKDEMADQLIHFQLEIIKKLEIVPSEMIQADNAVTTLMYTEAESAFSVWRNGAPEGLLAYPVPKDLANFSMTASWKKDTKLPFKAFFKEYYEYRG